MFEYENNTPSETQPVSRPQPDIVHVQIGASYGFWISGLIVSFVATFLFMILIRAMYI